MGLRTGGRRAKSLKNRVKSSKIELRFREVRPEGCTSCSPVLQALIIFQTQLYGSASAEPFFAAPFPENRGARLRISGGCPARGEPEALIDLCSSIACRAQPCQRCSPVLQALIYLSVHFYGSASAEPFFVAHFSGERGSTTAHLRRLLIFAQASRAKTKSIGLRLFCKLFMNPIDKVGEQEYIFSSRAYRVLKVKQTAP